MSTCAHYKALFRQAAQEGRVRVRTRAGTDSLTSLDDRAVAHMCSIVDLAVRGSMLAHGVNPTPEGIEAWDLGPILHRLPAVGEEAAKAGVAGKPQAASSVRNVRSALRRFVSTVTGEDVASKRPRRVAPEELPAGTWRALGEYLVAHPLVSANGNRRTGLPELLFLQQLAAERGIVAPEDLPVPEKILAWAEHDADREVRLDAGLVAYRRARRAIPPDVVKRLHECLAETHPRTWGIDALSDLPERLHAGLALQDDAERARLAALIETPDALTMRGKIALLAPDFALALDAFLARAAAEAHQPVYVQKVIGGMSRIVATLIRLAETDHSLDPSQLEFAELWLRSVGRRAPTKRAASSRIFGDAPADDNADVSILRHVTDHSMLRRIERSVLVHKPNVVSGQQPYYADSAFADVRHMYYVACAALEEEFCERRAKQGGKERWAELAAEHHAIIAYMAKANSARSVMPSHRLQKEDHPLIWPQLVCVLLWDLRRRVLELDMAIARLESKRRRTAESSAPGGSYRGQVLAHRLRTALRDYFFVASVVVDGLRLKNYVHAIANVHFRPTVQRGPHGEWLAFTAMSTQFGGDDCPSVRLKITQNRNKTFRDRTWDWPAGMVDLRLVYRYWTHVRQHDLRCAGLLAPTETFDLDADRFAVFVSPKSVCGKALPSEQYAVTVRDSSGTAVRVSPGNMTDPTARLIWGRAIHRVCKDVLRLRDIPPTLAACRKRGSEWRVLVGPHGARALAAVFFGTYLDRWRFASNLTDDKRYTLERTYAIKPRDFEAREGTGGPGDPQVFRRLISWMMNPRARHLDWAAFWEHFAPFRWVPTSGAEKGHWEFCFTGGGAKRSVDETALLAVLQRRTAGTRSLHHRTRRRRRRPVGT